MLNNKQELCAPTGKEASACEMFSDTDRQMPLGFCVLTGLRPSYLFVCMHVTLDDISPVSLVCFMKFVLACTSIAVEPMLLTVADCFQTADYRTYHQFNRSCVYLKIDLKDSK